MYVSTKTFYKLEMKAQYYTLLKQSSCSHWSNSIKIESLRFSHEKSKQSKALRNSYTDKSCGGPFLRPLTNLKLFTQNNPLTVSFNRM